MRWLGRVVTALWLESLVAAAGAAFAWWALPELSDRWIRMAMDSEVLSWIAAQLGACVMPFAWAFIVSPIVGAHAAVGAVLAFLWPGRCLRPALVYGAAASITLYVHEQMSLSDTVILLLLTPVPALAARVTRGRRHRPERPEAIPCSECGYDLTGNTSGVCPECGQEVMSGKC